MLIAKFPSLSVKISFPLYLTVTSLNFPSTKLLTLPETLICSGKTGSGVIDSEGEEGLVSEETSEFPTE